MSKYELKIELSVLHHLGLNLYSNIPAVLSELIANAWDADATEVQVRASTEEITITDDGCGMSSDDLNKKFLSVGYARRQHENGDITPKFKRKVMGRKGIGKLSIFSIAENIDVYTKKDNEVIGINLLVSDIKETIDKKGIYHPKEITVPETCKFTSESGTIIVLKQLKKRVHSSIDKNLKRRVSRRFDIFSDKFEVSINDEVVSVEDMDYFHKLEFALVYGDYSTDKFSSISGDKIRKRDNVLKLEGLEDAKISGWIGLVKNSGELLVEGENLNKISLLTRGKVALENILESYRDGGLYTKFLMGQIKADFLDLTEEDDIATSNRQDFIQGDSRFVALREFIYGELKHVQNERAKYKEEEGAQEAQEIPAIKEWMNALQGNTKQAAKKLFGKINNIATDKEHRKTLYKHGVLAFEHMHYKERLSNISELNMNDIELVLKLLAELDDIEASWYYQITEGRLEVIEQLNQYVDKDVFEKVLQQYIYDHLWLLDPAWDRATENVTMERRIISDFDKMSENISKEERDGRYDIRYKKTEGKHVVIELKRSSITPKVGELMDQITKYTKALETQLRHNNDDSAVEAICLVGKGLVGWSDGNTKQGDEYALKAKNIRVITYKQLIIDAQNSYKDYLSAKKKKGRISEILRQIDEVE